MDSKTFAIGVLGVTAAVLLAALVIVNVLPQAAVAADVGTTSGDYTLTVGHYMADADLLYLIDNPTQRMVVYGIDRRSGRMIIAFTAELSQFTQ